jgi:hypothetical protein
MYRLPIVIATGLATCLLQTGSRWPEPAGVNLPGVEALILLKLTLNNSITPEQDVFIVASLTY